MRRVLLFMGAFGVLLVRCRCFLVTLLQLRGYLPLTHLLNGSVEYIMTTLDIFCVCEPPEDGRQTGPKHVV
jgi:hypothetical protein